MSGNIPFYIPKHYVGQGTGGLYVDEQIQLQPILQGGTGSRSFETVHPLFMPDIIESGTANTPGIAGLAEGIDWILKTGIKAIAEKKEMLLQRLYERLSGNKRIELYSTVEPHKNSGILALLITGMDSSETANLLDARYNIAVRPGFHCAPLAHKALRTENTGLVRISPGYFTTPEEIDYTAAALIEIAGNA